MFAISRVGPDTLFILGIFFASKSRILGLLAS